MLHVRLTSHTSSPHRKNNYLRTYVVRQLLISVIILFKILDAQYVVLSNIIIFVVPLPT